MFTVTVFLKGVAIVGTRSADIGSNSPVLVLRLTQATFILLLVGDADPKADRQMSS